MRKQPNLLIFSTLILVLMLSSTVSYGQQRSKQGVVINHEEQYKVVINHEEQYSIWPAKKALSGKWKDTKFRGDRLTCQKYIQEVWTDMRPLSIQKMGLPQNTRYQVVINHEEQYSIWPAEKQLMRGWKATKTQGTLKECSQYIEEVWTDMRPLSVKKQR